MKLTWKQKDFEKDIDFILFHQKDGTPVWWQKQLFNVYPDLNYEYAKSLTEEKRFEYITGQMKIQSEKRKPIIDNSINEFSKKWHSLSSKAENAFTQAFNSDCSGILNDMVAEVGLNPICPRDIESHTFDIYHYFDPRYAITTALHEITHFAWFYFWNKHFQDNPEEYDFPNIKWLLSEIVVETIIRNSDINDLIEQPEYIAYSYFYDIKIGNELIFDTMKQMYMNSKDIYDFMDKAFEWIKSNETELRDKIQKAESK